MAEIALSNCFVILHLHSQYSLLDGGNRLDRLVERVKQLGMDAVAVTDHGNLFGAVEFYQLGDDFYVSRFVDHMSYNLSCALRLTRYPTWSRLP